MFNEDYYDVNNIDDLYYNEYDNWDDDIETVEESDWENYYHNVADEIVDE